MPPKKDPKPKAKDEKSTSKGKGKDAKASGSNTGNKKPSSSKDTDNDGGGSKLKPCTSINVRHILCEKHAKKEEALARLNGGSSFADVAREFSEDKARQGGSLGWKGRGELIKEFETVAFGLAVSSSLVGGSSGLVVGECRTAEGYHLVCVEGRR